MLPLVPRSSIVFFPLSKQTELFKPDRIHEVCNGTKFLLSGITQNVIFSKKSDAGRGGAFVQIDPVVEWVDKQHFTIGGEDKVPLLCTDRHPATIERVEIRDVHRQVVDPWTRDDIEKILSKLRFSVHYSIRKIDSAREEGLYCYDFCINDETLVSFFTFNVFQFFLVISFQRCERKAEPNSRLKTPATGHSKSYHCCLTKIQSPKVMVTKYCGRRVILMYSLLIVMERQQQLLITSRKNMG